MMISNVALAVATLAGSASAWVKNIDIHNPPYKADPGAYGYNQCGTKSSPDSKCQNLYLRSAEDFCLFAPHDLSGVSETEREAVAYCTKDGHGTRLIPNNTFEGVHFVHTEHYVQITGTGNFTKLNVLQGDDGGELDAAGYDARGNPISGIVFGFDNQFERWVEFLLPNMFCMRACFNGPEAWRYCNHIYDEMGCPWNIPGNYSPGFDECVGEDVPHPMGEYVQPDGSIKRWKQHEKPIPPPGAPGRLISCRTVPPPGGNSPDSAVPAPNVTSSQHNSTGPGTPTTPASNVTSTQNVTGVTGQHMPRGGSSNTSGPGPAGQIIPAQNVSQANPNEQYPTEGSGPPSSPSSSPDQPQTGQGSPVDGNNNSAFNHGTVSSVVHIGSVSVGQGHTPEISIPGMDETLPSSVNSSSQSSETSAQANGSSEEEDEYEDGDGECLA